MVVKVHKILAILALRVLQFFQFFQPNFFVFKDFFVIPKVSESSLRVLHDFVGLTEKYV